MQILSPNGSNKIDPNLIDASMRYYGLPIGYNRTFAKNGSFGAYTPEQAAELNSPCWVQLNLTKTGMRLTKPSNADIETVLNISLDAEYPPEPHKIHWVGMRLAEYLTSIGYAQQDLPVEDSGAGIHIILPITPLVTAGYGGGDAVNKAVAKLVNEEIKPTFDSLSKEVGLGGLIKLEAFDIARIMSFPGSYRPGGSKPNEIDYLTSGYVRKWLNYGDDNLPTRVMNVKLHDRICEITQELSTVTPRIAGPVIRNPVVDTVSANVAAVWLGNHYDKMGKASDRSTNFYKLVCAAWVYFGDDSVILGLANDIDNLTGGKYSDRAYSETLRCLGRAHELEHEENNTKTLTFTRREGSPAPASAQAVVTVGEVMAEEIPTDTRARDTYLQRAIASVMGEPDMGVIALKQVKARLGEALGLNKGEIDRAFKDAEKLESQEDTTVDPFFFAQVLVKKYRDNLVYDDETKQWHAWEGTYWKLIADEKSVILDRYVREAIIECGAVARGGTMNDTLRHARVLLEGKLEAVRGLVNFKNGTLTADTMALAPHQKADSLTYCLPYDYDATGECPNFIAYLTGRIPDKEARLTIAEHIGLAFLRDTSLGKALIFKGEPGSGKSKMLDIILLLFGLIPGAYAPRSIFSPDNESIRSRSEWQDRLICPIDEVPSDAFQNEETFKRLTTHGGADARAMNQNANSKPWQAKFVMTCNDPPKFGDKSGAVKRRLLVILYGPALDPKKYDLKLLDKIVPELGAIARLSIEAAKEVYARNGYTVSRKMEVTLDAICSEGDILKQFVAERCRLAVEDKVSTDTYTSGGPELYEAFQKYCETNGVRIPPTKPKVTKDLLAYAAWKLHSRRGNAGLVWKGIKLLDPTDPRFDNPMTFEERIAEGN